MSEEVIKNNLKEEVKIQEKLNDCVDEAKSFCFDAGAGAGKTYALVNTIRYILQDENKRQLLRNRSQKILCITYTNAAKDEIINRIGHNSEVVISTIHDFLWDFISIQQTLLVQQHKDKIRNEQKRAEKLEEAFIREYSLEKDIFKEKVTDQGFLKAFHQNYAKNALPFKEAIGLYDNFWNGFKFSVSKLKKAVSAVNSLLNYEKALENNNSKVKYLPTRNRDDLANYIISHDTLLDYSKNIIEKSNLLQRLLLDNYPYVFIDEYQDTDKRVIDIITSIKEYANKKKKRFVVGYFGDALQNIYKNGIGALPNINEYVSIQKKFNRRSTTQIVSIIEKIRNDGFGQRAIDENNNDGLCKFYLSDTNFDLEKFLKENDLTRETACLLLKNKDIADKREFNELLAVISKYPRFSDSNYVNINNEFLQKNQQRIGWFLRDVLTFVGFILCVRDDSSTVSKIIKFMQEPTNRITFNEMSELIKKIRLQVHDNMTLEECIKQLSQIDKADSIIKNIFSINDKSTDLITHIKNNAFEYLLFSDANDSELLDGFFDIKFVQFKNWYNYVFNKDVNTGLTYQTLHGSKGLEFDNVVVVLQDNFARKKDYCYYFFDNYNDPDTEDKQRFNKVRNLLYVACSRTKKNLYVIYETKDYQELLTNDKLKILTNIKTIFSEIEFIGNTLDE